MDASDSITLIAQPADEGERLDRFVAGHIDAISRSQFQRLNADGAVTVSGRTRADSYRLVAGDVVVVARAPLREAVDPATQAPQPQQLPLKVTYEDDEIVVVNKAAGMVVHPAHGNEDGTLVNALLGRGSRLSELGSPDRPGIVHRLDKDTSGLMAVAKTDAAYRHLVEQIKTGRLEKTYHALARGHLPRTRSIVDAPISRHPTDRQRMAVVAGGKPARTDVLVVDRYRHLDYIRVSTQTGRTHQIRVHLAHVGHPLLGDPVYGGRKHKGLAHNAGSRELVRRLLKIVKRHALHASRLSFAHPGTRRRMTFTTALPDDLRTALEILHREDRFEGGLD